MVKLILVIIGLGLGVLGIVAISSTNKGQENSNPNSLRQIAEQAKSERKHQITIPARVEYAGTESPPDSILSNATIIVAQPIQSYSYAPNDEDIVTWYKFRVIETIAEGPPCPRCPNRTPPDEILPLNEGEFLLAKYGGTLPINGVEVTKVEAGFPPFVEHEKYLLLLSKSRNGTASLIGGPNGTYTVSEEGQITPVNQRPTPLKEVIKQRFNGSVRLLKQQLKKS